MDDSNCKALQAGTDCLSCCRTLSGTDPTRVFTIRSKKMHVSSSFHVKPSARQLPHCPARPCKLPAVAAVPPRSRFGRSRSSSAPNAVSHSTQAADAVVIDIDAVVQGLEVIVTHWAFAAATATAGQIDGSPAVYTRYMQQLLPVIQQPYEAALMLRLLHDEGTVGEYILQAGASLANGAGQHALGLFAAHWPSPPCLGCLQSVSSAGCCTICSRQWWLDGALRHPFSFTSAC